MMNLHQIRGITALVLILAAIPLFRFTDSAQHPANQVPPFSTAQKNKVAIELISKGEISGIYFVDGGWMLKHFLRRIGTEISIADDVSLKNAMTVKLPGNEKGQQVIIGKMTSAKRLALGLPIDINQASYEDLILVPGIGPATAEKIVSRRDTAGHFNKVEELMKISGIKEKKLAKLSTYLCVE